MAFDYHTGEITLTKRRKQRLHRGPLRFRHQQPAASVMTQIAFRNNKTPKRRRSARPRSHTSQVRQRASQGKYDGTMAELTARGKRHFCLRFSRIPPRPFAERQRKSLWPSIVDVSNEPANRPASATSCVQLAANYRPIWPVWRTHHKPKGKKSARTIYFLCILQKEKIFKIRFFI